MIHGDDVAARPFAQPRGQRAPIDQFFRSVAIGRGDGMAVILSGAGSDGALGVRAVKEAGGVIFVQEPATAEYPMMPRSALAAGGADFVAPIPRLVERMIEVTRSKMAIMALSNDIAALVRPELRLDLRSAVRRALEQGEPTLSPPIPVSVDGDRRRIMLNVAPVIEQENVPVEHALVLFLDAGAALAAAEGNGNDELQRLREELDVAATRLTGSRADHEAAIQDLRIANEELQSINEEYRSTSEELETSKEELQSMNEELQTVNAELKNKLHSIGAAHSDLENMIAATDIGTLFLDTKLRIRMFTPRVARIFNITDADIGRAITDFTHGLNYEGLAGDVQQVLTNLVPVERELENREGRWHMVRLRPYRTVDNCIDGVVVTFVDMTEQRLATERLRQSEERYRILFETMSEGLLFAEVLTDESGSAVDVRLTGANPAATAMFRADITDTRLTEVSPDFEAEWWEIPARVLASGASERHELHAGPLGQWFDALFWKARPDDGHVAILLRDVTERRHGQEALQEARDALALATQSSRLGWGAWDFGTGGAMWDERGREIIGLDDGETSIEDWMARVQPEDRPLIRREIDESVRESRPFDLQYGVLHRDGSLHQVHGTGMFELGAGRTAGTGLVRDVTERKRWEESQRLLVGELNHRVKNMLAVVQSVAQQTQRSSDSIEGFTRALSDRIQALAGAHGLLTRRNWADVDLRELVEEVARTFTASGDGARIRITGPELALRPDVTISFAMGLHELGTNSMKHGALSVPEGRIDISWSIDGVQDCASFNWVESGGPPVRPPAREGFGTKLLKRGIVRELDGTARLDYQRDGVRFHLEFPLNGAVTQ